MLSSACASAAWKESVNDAALKIPATYGSAEWQPFGDDTVKVEAVPGAENLVKAEVLSTDGRPRLYINGEKVTPLAYFDYQGVNSQETLTMMKEQENLVSVVLSDSAMTYPENIRVEVVRTTLSAAYEKYKAERPRGEFVLVIRGAPVEKGPRLTLEEAMEILNRHRSEGKSLKEAARLAAVESGQSKNDLYHAALVLEKEDE